MNKVDLARDLVSRIPGAPARTLARRLVLDYPDLFTLSTAYGNIRRALGVHGEKNRKRSKTHANRAKGEPGWTPSFPPSAAEPWKPYQIKGPAVVLSLSDFHVPYHDKAAIETIVAYAKRRHKITHVLINGDYMDFYQKSRFNKNPNKRSLREELGIGRDGLVWLREQFKRQEMIYKRGNHDERWNLWCWNHAPQFSDCEHMQLSLALKFANYGYTEVGDEPVMAGKLPILHGHELGQGPASPVNPARGAFMRTLYTVLVAHHHQTSTHAQSNMFHEETAAFSQGCLCDLTPEYARVNKWNHGAPVIEVDSRGMFNLINYRIGTGGAVRAA